MRACPRCGSALREQQVGVLLVDGCDSCGGVWFDTNELARLASMGREAVTRAEEQFEPPAPPADSSPAGEGGQCPACGVPLYEFEFPHTPGIKLDACPQCRGVWADDHELAAIAARMPGGEAAANGPSGTRHKVRRVVSFAQRVPCRKCGEANHASSLVCWVCGTALCGRRGAMLCPRCDNPLWDEAADDSCQARGTPPHVDHCHACGGIWLEVATLSELMELSVDRLEDWTGKLAALVFDGAQQVAGDVLCPTCHLRLDERAYAASGDVYVDRCVSCRGTWLDNGELVAIRRISIEQDVWGQAL